MRAQVLCVAIIPLIYRNDSIVRNLKEGDERKFDILVQQKYSDKIW